MPKNNIEQIALLSKIIAYSPEFLITDPAKKKPLMPAIETKKELALYSGTSSHIYLVCDPQNNFIHPENISPVLKVLSATYDKIILFTETNINSSSSDYQVNVGGKKNISQLELEELLPLTNIPQIKIAQITPNDEKNNCQVRQISYYVNPIKSNQSALVEQADTKDKLIRTLMEIHNKGIPLVFLDKKNHSFVKTIYMTLTTLLKNEDSGLSQYEDRAVNNRPIPVYNIVKTSLPIKQPPQEQVQLTNSIRSMQVKLSKQPQQKLAPETTNVFITNIFGNNTTDAFKQAYDLMKYITLREYFYIIIEELSKRMKFILDKTAEVKSFTQIELHELQVIKEHIESFDGILSETNIFKKLYNIFLDKNVDPSLINDADITYLEKYVTGIRNNAIIRMEKSKAQEYIIQALKGTKIFSDLLTSLSTVINNLSLLSKPLPQENKQNNDNSCSYKDDGSQSKRTSGKRYTFHSSTGSEENNNNNQSHKMQKLEVGQNIEHKADQDEDNADKIVTKRYFSNN